MGLGLCLWLNQLLYILGIDMSGVVVATCMQPIIPVFTAMLAVALKLEAGSVQKFAGIGIAVGGSLCMVQLLILVFQDSLRSLFLLSSAMCSTSSMLHIKAFYKPQRIPLEIHLNLIHNFPKRECLCSNVIGSTWK